MQNFSNKISVGNEEYDLNIDWFQNEGWGFTAHVHQRLVRMHDAGYVKNLRWNAKDMILTRCKSIAQSMSL